MDRFKRIAKRIATTIWRGLRRWPKTSVLAVILFVLLVVPVWPYFPSCENERYDPEAIYVRMSPEYRTVLTRMLESFGVYTWEIGGMVFVRVLPTTRGIRSSIVATHS